MDGSPKGIERLLSYMESDIAVGGYGSNADWDGRLHSSRRADCSAPISNSARQARPVSAGYVYVNEHTKQDYRTALRSFGSYRLKHDESPDSLDRVLTGTSNNCDPVPYERDLLRWKADIEPMIRVPQNSRDAVLIALQFEAGLHSGELYDLRLGNLFDLHHSLGLHVDGKRTERTVHLIISMRYVQRWRSENLTPNDDTAPM